jgi:translation initiation factor 3 subunit G
MGGDGGGREGGTDRRRDENSVRVTNLSEDVSEADLAELFRPFGHVPRIYLAVDRTTGESRGFAFITFAHRYVVVGTVCWFWGPSQGRKKPHRLAVFENACLPILYVPLFREDGERAIRTLNGYGYGHLILKVEWAAPREAR